jgi:Fe2+ transport system protein FeoA
MFTYRHKHHRIVRETSDLVLTDLEDDKTAVIVSINGGRHASKRLADLGLKPGTEIKIIRKTLFSGPLQIEVCGSKLVIGRGLASKIAVVLK